MSYICIKDVNTEFGTFKIGDKVSDELGKRYSQFEKEIEVVEAVKEKKKKESKPKEELLVETPSKVDVLIEDTVEDTVEA